MYERDLFINTLMSAFAQEKSHIEKHLEPAIDWR